jgi:hypothetical protein
LAKSSQHGDYMGFTVLRKPGSDPTREIVRDPVRYTQSRCPGHPTKPNQTVQPHAMHFDPLADSAIEVESSPARGADGYPVRRRDSVREAMPQR